MVSTTSVSEQKRILVRGAPKLNPLLHIETEPQKLRSDYIKLYGKDVWDQAASLASRHRSRASTKYGLSEHFTAGEWLKLCARTDFCCSSCGANAPLEPHHRKALCIIGPNTIDNVSPLCSACHHLVPVPTGIKDVSATWLSQQEDVYLKRPPINTLIRYEYWGYAPNNGRLGVVVKTEAPVLETGPLWGRQPQERDPIHNRVEPLRQSMLESLGIYPPVQPLHTPPLAWVKWADHKETSCVELCYLSAVNVEATKKEALSWLRVQEELVAPWAIGNYVCPHQHKKQIKHGVIEQIVPYKAQALTGFIGEDDGPNLPAQWLPQSPAMAKVRWTYTDGTTKVT